MDKFSHIFPFILAAGSHVHMNSQRIFEAILIAVITAIGTGYTVTVRLEERDKHQTYQLQALTGEVRELRGEIGEAKVKIGDRWTASMQRQFEKELDIKLRDHEIRGHWNGPNRANKLD